MFYLFTHRISIEKLDLLQVNLPLPVSEIKQQQQQAKIVFILNIFNNKQFIDDLVRKPATISLPAFYFRQSPVL
jgi:hypothetical protein